MNFNCKNEQVVWKKINGAYVAATTICNQTVQSSQELPRIETKRTSFYRDLSLGENIIFMSNFKITFESVTSPGYVYVVQDSENFNYFDIFTTSTFSGHVSFSSPIPDNLDFSEAKFIRILEDGSMEDITVPNPIPESGRGLSIEGTIQPSLTMLENGSDYYPVGSFGVVSSSAMESQTVAGQIIVSGCNSGQTILNPDGTISCIDWQYQDGYEPCPAGQQLFVYWDENGISFECDCYTTVLSIGGALAIFEAIAIAYSAYKALMMTVTTVSNGIRAFYKLIRGLADDILDLRQEISALTDLANASRARQAAIRARKLKYQQEGIDTKELDEILNMEIQDESALNAQIRDASDTLMNKVFEKENAQVALDAAISQRTGLLEQAAAILISIRALYEALAAIPVLAEKKVCPEGQTLGEDCECFYNVTVIRESDSVTFRVRENETILDAAELNSVNLLVGEGDSCRSGACATCVMKKVSGCIDQEIQSFLDEDMIKHCYTTTCVSYPKSDLVLDSTKTLNINTWHNEVNETPECPDAELDGCCDCPPPNDGGGGDGGGGDGGGGDGGGGDGGGG